MGLKLELVERQQDIGLDKGTFGHVCVLDSGLAFVFRHLRSGLIYVLDLSMALSEAVCCGIVHVRREHQGPEGVTGQVLLGPLPRCCSPYLVNTQASSPAIESYLFIQEMFPLSTHVPGTSLLSC